MAECARCAKTGTFLKLYKGLCIDCAKIVQEELRQASEIITAYTPRFESMTSNPSISISEAMDCAQPLKRALSLISDYCDKGYATTQHDSIQSLPDLVQQIDHFILNLYLYHATRAASTALDPVEGNTEALQYLFDAKTYYEEHHVRDELLLARITRMEHELQQTL